MGTMLRRPKTARTTLQAALLCSLLFLAACRQAHATLTLAQPTAAVFPPPTPTPLLLPISELTYTLQASARIVFVDIHYPGIPEPKDIADPCYRPYRAALRIWGDGTVYLNEKLVDDPSEILSGQISAGELEDILETLNTQGFFTNWGPPGPNPAGTDLRIGATLKNRPAVEYTTGDVGLGLYVDIAKAVKPKLTAIDQQDTVDARVGDTLRESYPCSRTPAVIGVSTLPLGTFRPGPPIILCITGLPEDALADFFVDRDGYHAIQGWRGNGRSSVVLPPDTGKYVIIVQPTVEIGPPISYTVYVDGMNIFWIEGQRVTDENVSELEFDFR